MADENKVDGRGGARPGAGRPKVEEVAKSRTIRLTDQVWAKLRAAGGPRWIERKLKEESDTQ